jgi:protein KRI1
MTKGEEKKKQQLDFSSQSDSDSNSDSDAPLKLSINKKFATEYEKRKRQQELVNARQEGEDYDDSDYSSSEDESEDENAELLTEKVDLQILKTIKALRTKDESIYNKNQKFFEDQDDNLPVVHEHSESKKKSKKKIYKDVVREQILEKMERGEEASDDEESENEIISRRNIESLSKLEYDEEQKAIRSDFLDDGNLFDDDDGELLTKKKQPEGDKYKDTFAKERQEALATLLDSTSTPLKDPKGEVEDADKFLLDFISNKRWVDPNDSDSDEDNNDNKNCKNKIDDGHDSDASLEDIERTDEFESRYNFRFEEANANSGAGLSVVGYARNALSDTIRRKDDSRKKKREERKERKAAERRLKNAKKEQLEERISQIKSVLGSKMDAEDDTAIEKDLDEELVAKLMEGDFDEDKYEELMNKLYNDDFYEKEDSEWKTDSDVKNSLKKSFGEGDESGIAIDDDEADAIYDDGEVEFPDEHGDDEIHEEYTSHEGAQETDKNESNLEKKLKKKMLDELYKLDYEDIIGDMPTRFKYRKVEPNRYGLTPEEILYARDTTLKQFVSLKRMAPYDEGGEYVPGTKKRKRFRDMFKADYHETRASNHLGDDAEEEVANTGKKRRRQKKGKKKDENKVEMTKEDEANDLKTKTNDQNALENNSARKDPTEKVKRRKSGKKKNDKQKKQEGISSSRLASYGL